MHIWVDQYACEQKLGWVGSRGGKGWGSTQVEKGKAVVGGEKVGRDPPGSNKFRRVWWFGGVGGGSGEGYEHDRLL